jgi:hypothetical protein
MEYNDIRTHEDARARMQDGIDYYNERITAWGQVHRLRKKDGGDFAVLSKNFDNCRFYHEYGCNKLSVTFKSKKHGYETDYIYLDSGYYGDRADTPDKIEEVIATTIARYTEWRDVDARGLAKIDEVLTGIDEKLAELRRTIEDGRKDGIHYAVQYYIKNKLGIF